MGRWSRERKAEEAAKAAQRASEAARVLQSRRQAQANQSDAPEHEEQRNEPQSHEEEERPPSRNEPRRLAMEEIVNRDLETKGIAPESEPKPKPEQAEEPAPPTPDQMLQGGKFSQAEPPAEAPAEAPPAADPIKTVRVKVDGEEFDAPQSEVEAAGGLHAYQKDKAAENRLRKQNELLAETRRTQAEIVRWMQQQAAPAAQAPSTDQLLLKAAQARFGTDEEFAAAMRDMIEHTNPKIDQNAITSEAVSRMQQSLAVADFQKEFPEVISNPLVLKLATVLENERVAQMRQQGHTPDWPSFYRQIGNEVRSVIGRQSQPATTPVQATGTPSQVSSDKEARKASIVTLPTAAARAALPQESKPETREDILNQLRKSRGLPTG